MRLQALALFGFTVAGLAASDLKLIDAVKRRDHKAFAALMGQHSDVNAAQPDGATALAWAVFLGERETAERLLAAGAKVNSADEYGETPLTLACSNGDARLAEKLLQAGAEVNVARWNGETALMIAANSGSAEVVNLLIAKGSDVNAAEARRGQTALMWAVAEGHVEVAKVLIEHGANVKAASKSGFTPLVFAAVKNDPRIVRALIAAGADPNYKLPDGTKVLIVAASHKSSSAAGALVDNGADPNVADRGGVSPLHTAAQAGDTALVKKLLAKGANPNARTIKLTARRIGDAGSRQVWGEQTPLMMAARENHIGTVRALIEGGSDPKLKEQGGGTFLMAAVSSGHIEMVKYAFGFDKDMMAVTDMGTTLAHMSVSGTLANATQTDVCSVIQFLADNGAPLNEKDGRGLTPIDLADYAPIDKAVELLTQVILKSGAQPRSHAKPSP